MHKKHDPLFVLFFTIFLDMLGLGILIPVIPVLFASPESPHFLLPIGTPESTAYLLLGLLLATFSVGQFFASPIIGQFSDKFGRKRMLAFSIFGTAAAHALFAAAIFLRAVPLLFVARLFAGITGGNIVVAQAAIADVTKPEDRARNFGFIGAAFGLGFIIGPFVGGKLADPTILPWFNATVPFLFASLLSIVNGLLVLFYFNETHQTPNAAHVVRWGRSIANILHAFRMKEVRPLFFSNLLFQMGFSFYTTFSAVYLMSRFGFTEGATGNYFAYVGVWVVITQGFVTRMLAKRYTERTILTYAMPLAGVVLFGFVLAPSALFMYLLAPFFSIAIGLTQANITSLISRSVGPSVQGEILGINGSVNAMAQAIPPVLSGMLAALYTPSAPLIVASLLTISAGVFFALIAGGYRRASV